MANRLKAKEDALTVIAAEQSRIAAAEAAAKSAYRQAVFIAAGTLVMPTYANAVTVAGKGIIQAGAGAAVLAQAIADGIAALGQIAASGPGARIAAFVTLGLYSPATADTAMDRTPDRIRYGFGFKASQLGLPAGTDLQSIALAQGTVELPWRLSNEAKGDQSIISVIRADGVSVPKGVPVRAATLNPMTGLYEVVLPTTIADQPPITLTWIPAEAPGSENPSSTTPAVPQEIPVYAGTTLQPITVTAESYPGVTINPDDLITWFPAESGIAPIYVMFSEPLDSGIFTKKQLDKKYKHASRFGVEEAQKNRQTLTKFRDAIEAHLADKDTFEKGTYIRNAGS